MLRSVNTFILNEYYDDDLQPLDAFLGLLMHPKCILRSGLRPEPRWGNLQCSPDTLAHCTSKESLPRSRPSATNLDPSNLRSGPPRQIPGHAADARCFSY